MATKFDALLGKLREQDGSAAGDVVGPGSATDHAIVRFDSTTGKLVQNSGITIADGASGSLSGTNTGDQTIFGIIGITIDGGGSAITTGVKGYVSIPYACTINSWVLLADQSGSIVIDVWKDTLANYPPTVADTIAGTEKPTLSAATNNTDTSLSTWTTSVSAGDIIGFNVDSASTVTRVTLVLKVTRT